MHQHPRPSPVTASPASSPRTNPTRTNNPRDEGLSPHSRAGSDIPGYNEADEGSGDSGVIATSGPSRDAVKKLDQIIQVNTPAILSSLGKYLHHCPQNFHTKAAIVVLQSRMPLPVILTKDGTKKVNKWVYLLLSTLKEHPQANSSFLSFK